MSDEAGKPEALTQVESDRQLCLIRVSPSGQYLCGGTYDAQIRCWNPAELVAEPVLRISGHHGWVQWLEFHPQEDILYSCDTWGMLAAWQLRENQAELLWQQEQAHDGWIRSLAVSNDGSIVITGGRDGHVRLWNAADGQLLQDAIADGQEVYAVAVHPGSQEFVSADLFGVLRRWERGQEQCVSEVRLEGMHLFERDQDLGGVRQLIFADEQTLVCSGGEPKQTGNTIAVPVIHWLSWPALETAESLRLGDEQQGYVFDLCRYPDDQWAAVTSGQPGKGQVMLFRRGDEEPWFRHTALTNCHSITVLADGHFVAAATNRNSQGNGAVRDKEGNYLGNTTPLQLFSPGSAATAE